MRTVSPPPCAHPVPQIPPLSLAPGAQLGLRDHGRAVPAVSKQGLPQLTCRPGRLSGVGPPRGEPVPHAGRGHAGGLQAALAVPCRAECARYCFPRPGTKCPGKAGLEAGRGGGRSCHRDQPHCTPIPLLLWQALSHLQPPDMGHGGLPMGSFPQEHHGPSTTRA